MRQKSITRKIKQTIIKNKVSTANNQDLFDTENIADLPGNVKSAVECARMGLINLKLLSLFAIKSELNLSEVVAGMYRKYKFARPRAAINSMLNGLSKGKFLVKIENRIATYKIGKRIPHTHA